MSGADHDQESSDPWSDDFRRRVLAINFVADAGRQMLESSTSVSEVIERLRRFLPAVGLQGCSVDANLSSLTLSHWQRGQAVPLTTMRELNVASPRLQVLTGTDGLLDRVERGDVTLEDAVVDLDQLIHAPRRRAYTGQIAMLVSVAGWVLFLDGATLVTIAVALVATVLTFPIGRLVDRLRLPSTAATFLVAVIVAAIPNLLAAAGLNLRVGAAIVGALFIYLPGRAFVSSVIDGLANAPISSLARGIEAILAAGFLALGMLVGSRIGTGLGLNYEPNLDSTPLVLSIAGAAIGILGIAVAWSMPNALLAPTIAMSSVSWFIIALVNRNGEGSGWAAYIFAAGVVGALGTLVAAVQDSSASVYTGVAILPLVPGFTLYTGMLAIAQGDTDTATASLSDAGIISLSIAVGVAVGLSVTRNAIEIGKHIRPPTDLGRTG